MYIHISYIIHPYVYIYIFTHTIDVTFVCEIRQQPTNLSLYAIWNSGSTFHQTYVYNPRVPMSFGWNFSLHAFSIIDLLNLSLLLLHVDAYGCTLMHTYAYGCMMKAFGCRYTFIFVWFQEDSRASRTEGWAACGALWRLVAPGVVRPPPVQNRSCELGCRENRQ